MSKMTIVEAAKEALYLLGAASSLKQIYSKIMERSFYKFGAKDPPVSYTHLTLPTTPYV